MVLISETSGLRLVYTIASIILSFHCWTFRSHILLAGRWIQDVVFPLARAYFSGMKHTIEDQKVTQAIDKLRVTHVKAAFNFFVHIPVGMMLLVLVRLPHLSLSEGFMNIASLFLAVPSCSARVAFQVGEHIKARCLGS